MGETISLKGTDSTMSNQGIFSFLTLNERDVIWLHLLFTGFCLPVLLAPMTVQPGIRIFFLVATYNLLVPLWARRRGYDDWINVWCFSFILSLFQVFPDWFLSAQLNILVFPEDGLFKIGTVSGYMGGLWTIPIFLIVYTGQRMRARFSDPKAYGAVVIASLLLFGGSEQTLWMLSSWYARDVIMVGHMAVYIIVPEIILGLSSFYGFQRIEKKPYWLKIPAAFLVMQVYLGSAAFFYFFIERILF